MRILHIVLGGLYMEEMSYQEIVLPRFHRRMGHEVYVLATCEVYREGRMSFVEPCCKRLADGVVLIRAPFVNVLGRKLYMRLRIVPGMEGLLERISPDFIMLHGLSSLSIPALCRYMKRHRQTRLVADNHADLSNSGTNFISRRLIQGGLWRLVSNMVEPYVETFFGVMPSRVDYLTEVYRLPRRKCRLLLMGVDDDLAAKASQDGARRAFRERFGIGDDEFLIVTGGKIDRSKRETLWLLRTVRRLGKRGLRLIVFGAVDDSLRERFMSYVDGALIQFIGWLDAKDTYPVIGAADLCVYPGRHSVLWEQTVGQGIPMVCKLWEGTTHVDIGGNVVFLKNDSPDELESVISRLSTRGEDYEGMLAAARGDGREAFLYSNIARECLVKRGEEEG